MSSFLLKSGEVGNIGLKQMKLVREQTIEKWDRMGFLEGLDGHTKDNVAQLFENQASFLINEATATDAAGSFETVVFPIIRRVFSKLLANEIVSVQALNMPIGRIFFFVPKISERINYGGGIFGHTNPFGYPNGGTGTPTADQATTFQSTNLYDAYYDSTSGLDNNQLFDRSKGAYQEFTTNTNSGLRQVTLTTLSGGTSVFTTVAANLSTGCTRYVTLEVTGFTSGGAGKIIGPNGNEMDTEEFLASFQVLNDTNLFCCSGSTGGLGSGAGPNLLYAAASPMEFRIVTQKYARQIVDYWKQVTGTLGGQSVLSSAQDVCTANGLMYVEVDLSCPAAVSSDSVDGYVGSYLPGGAGETRSKFYAKWRQYRELEFEAALGEVSFELDSVTISVTERKLRAQWSPEMAQDVSAFHNIDAEAELTAILSEEIAAEIDREILRDLRKAAAWRLRWDWNGWKRFSAGQAPYTQKDWNQTLITAINQISAQIFKSTLRGGANWIVCSAEVSAIFDDLQYFHVSNANPEEDQYNMGIEKIGTLQGRYKVYRDPYFPANKVLIGHKGSSMLDTGYVYAPYVPLQLTPTMYNPFTFAPIKGIMTRYATKVLNNRFYGVITVDGVRTFNIAELR